MLQSLGSQRVRHDSDTEQQQGLTECQSKKVISYLWILDFFPLFRNY